jgi:predicted esterase
MKINIYFKTVVLFTFLHSWITLYSQHNVTTEQQKSLSIPEIDFLKEEPLIDGILDSSLFDLPERQFTFHVKGYSTGSELNKTSYRLAYGTNFLYLYIEIDIDTIICRDRGYQNGDGFTFTIAKPLPDNQSTDEYFVLGLSATESSEEYTRKIVWHNDMNISFRRLGEDTKFETEAFKDRAGFELLLPWSEVYPFHPWLSDGIGFNLVFVNAKGNEEDLHFHTLIKDGQMYIGDNESRQMYLRLQFEELEPLLKKQCYMMVPRNCLACDSLWIKYSTLSRIEGSEKVDLEITNKESGSMKMEQFTFNYPKGLFKNDCLLNISDLSSGDYQITAKSGEQESRVSEFTLLPDFNYETFVTQLSSLNTSISSGSINTLKFKAEWIRDQINSLKYYRNYAGLRVDMLNTIDILEKAKLGNDIYKMKTGVFRRAFRSKIDNELQPYSIKIPDNYDPSKEYRLLVWLHGSDMDDRGHLEDKILEDDIIAIAPNGRGKRHDYTTSESQIDIQEAINDAIANYPIDSTKIILAGFSMGGYGVYRTFYETPDLYCAIAIFSGQPDMATEDFPDENYPNFLKDEYLQPLKGKQVFIAHGRKDMNVSFESTEKGVEKLKSIGAIVKFQIDPEMGHGISKETWKEFCYWLDKVDN